MPRLLGIGESKLEMEEIDPAPFPRATDHHPATADDPRPARQRHVAALSNGQWTDPNQAWIAHQALQLSSGWTDLVAAIFLALEQGRGSESLYVASAKGGERLGANRLGGGGLRGSGSYSAGAADFCAIAFDGCGCKSWSARSRTPSLTRDRVREVWPDRWVVDGSKFERLANWQAKGALGSALVAAHDYYVREGRL